MVGAVSAVQPVDFATAKEDRIRVKRSAKLGQELVQNECSARKSDQDQGKIDNLVAYE